MSNIILPINFDQAGQAVVSTLDFAEGLAIQHPSLIKTIRDYQEAIEKHFGRVRFEIGPLQTAGGIQQVPFACLTEDQALFVGSLSRNSERVVEFKSVLVRSFAEARRALAAGPLPSYQIPDPVERAQRWIQEEQQRQQLLAQVSELQPKADYVDHVLTSQTELTTTIIAQDMGISAQKLNKLLNLAGIQRKHRGAWVLYAAYQGKGYGVMKTHAYQDSKGHACTSHYLVWTEKGRELINRKVNPKLTGNAAIPYSPTSAHA